MIFYYAFPFRRKFVYLTINNFEAHHNGVRCATPIHVELIFRIMSDLH